MRRAGFPEKRGAGEKRSCGVEGGGTVASRRVKEQVTGGPVLEALTLLSQKQRKAVEGLWLGDRPLPPPPLLPSSQHFSYCIFVLNFLSHSEKTMSDLFPFKFPPKPSFSL